MVAGYFIVEWQVSSRCTLCCWVVVGVVGYFAKVLWCKYRQNKAVEVLLTL